MIFKKRMWLIGLLACPLLVAPLGCGSKGGAAPPAEDKGDTGAPNTGKPDAGAATEQTPTKISDIKEGEKSVTIAGQLSILSSSDSQAGAMMTRGIGPTRDAATCPTYNVFCVTYEDTPQAAKGDLNDQCEFNVTLKNASNVAFGCFIRQGTKTLGTMAVESQDETAMNGDAKQSEALSFSKDAKLGTISFNPDTGSAVIKKEQIQSADGSKEIPLLKVEAPKESIVDFSGTWKIAAIEAAKLPEGYEALCAPGQDQEQNQDSTSQESKCNGPEDGMTLFIKRFDGKAFKPSEACVASLKNWDRAASTCDGVASDKDAYGVAIWQSEEAFKACGSYLGFRNEEAKAFARIDFSAGLSDSLKDGGYALSTEIGDLKISDGWKFADAVSTRDVYGNCRFENGQSRCDDLLGAKEGKPQAFIDFNQKCATICKSGDACDPRYSAAEDNQVELANLRCYAEYFDHYGRQIVQQASAASCLVKPRFNFDAGKADDFIIKGGPSLAATQHVFERFEYTGATSGSFTQSNEFMIGVPVKIENGRPVTPVSSSVKREVVMSAEEIKQFCAEHKDDPMCKNQGGMTPEEMKAFCEQHKTDERCKGMNNCPNGQCNQQGGGMSPEEMKNFCDANPQDGRCQGMSTECKDGKCSQQGGMSPEEMKALCEKTPQDERCKGMNNCPNGQCNQQGGGMTKEEMDKICKADPKDTRCNGMNNCPNGQCNQQGGMSPEERDRICKADPKDARCNGNGQGNGNGNGNGQGQPPQVNENNKAFGYMIACRAVEKWVMTFKFSKENPGVIMTDYKSRTEIIDGRAECRDNAANFRQSSQSMFKMIKQ